MNTKDTNELVSGSLGFVGLNLNQIEDSNIYIYAPIECKAEQTLQIERIYMFDDPNFTVESVDVSLTEDGKTVDYQWDGTTPFTLNKDSEIKFYIHGMDEELKGKQIASKLYVAAIDYAIEGNTYSIYFDISAFTRMNAYEYFAILDSTNYYDFYRYYDQGGMYTEG